MRLLQFQLKYSCVCSAWSLLELLIVLALMAILASLGLPQIYSAWHLQSLHDERQKLAQQNRFARLTSLQKSAKVSLCWSQVCGSPAGFLVYLDANKDGLWQAPETPSSQWQINKRLSFRFNRGHQVSFNHAGNTAQSGTMVLCLAKVNYAADHQQTLGYALVISSSGRVRKTTAPCI